jgi:protein TonB
MVRALPFGKDRDLSLQRILALSTAIGVHALVFLLLLVPMAMPRVQPERAREQPQRWQIPIAVPKPPEPVRLEQPRPQPPTPVTPTRPVEVPPRPVDQVVQEVPPELPTTPAQTSAPQVAEPGPSLSSAPLEGASLQYAVASPPPYPARDVRSGTEGTVLLKILVDTDGTPIEVLVERSSGTRSLDDSARRHVLKHWKFKPAMDQGRAVQAWGLVPIDFRLGRG